jgi:hypothetical protein
MNCLRLARVGITDAPGRLAFCWSSQTCLQTTENENSGGWRRPRGLRCNRFIAYGFRGNPGSEAHGSGTTQHVVQLHSDSRPATDHANWDPLFVLDRRGSIRPGFARPFSFHVIAICTTPQANCCNPGDCTSSWRPPQGTSQRSPHFVLRCR